MTPVRVAENASLADRTTLRVGGPAKRLVTAESEAQLVEAVSSADARGEPVLVLGGGSNLVVADEGFPGTVILVATRGIDVVREDARALVTVAAGEPWDSLVEFATSHELSGIECLAGIPGLVGAVPMQNVGAYGQEVKDVIVRVRTWDRAERRVVDFAVDACGFAYRSSIFRGKSRHVVLSVTFAFERSASSRPIRYAELSQALGLPSGGRADLSSIRTTVLALRRKKGMVLDDSDPDTASAGSFFTNPILDGAELAALRRCAPPGMPVFAEPEGRAKVSAAWLIERAGFAKGFALGRAAISSKHALAITNRGGATAHEILALAGAIREGVRSRFGVALENEPVLVGFASPPW